MKLSILKADQIFDQDSLTDLEIKETKCIYLENQRKLISEITDYAIALGGAPESQKNHLNGNYFLGSDAVDGDKNTRIVITSDGAVTWSDVKDVTNDYRLVLENPNEYNDYMYIGHYPTRVVDSQKIYELYKNGELKK